MLIYSICTYRVFITFVVRIAYNTAEVAGSKGITGLLSVNSLYSVYVSSHGVHGHNKMRCNHFKSEICALQIMV